MAITQPVSATNIDEGLGLGLFHSTSARGVLATSTAEPQKSREVLTDLEDSREVTPAFPKFDDMRRVRIMLILMSLSLVASLYAIEQTIVSTSVAGIGSAVHTKGSLTWISTSYLLTATVFQPVIGRVADAVGPNRLLITEIWIFIIGNIIAGASNNITQLVAGRLISGVGGAGLLSLAIIIISQLTNERQRGAYLIMINVAFIVADSIGPLVGGLFLKSGNWRWIFFFNIPFGPIITLMLLWGIRLPPPPSQGSGIRKILAKMDLLGMVFIISALTFLVIGLNLGGQAFAWNSPTVIGVFSAAGVSFIAFVVAENYAELPVVPMRLFVQWKWRNVPIILVSRTMLYFHLFVTIFYLPIYLQLIGVSNIASAALVMPFLGSCILSSAVTNYVASKYGHVRPLFMLSLVILPVGVGLMSTLSENSSIGTVSGYTILYGWGFGSGSQISVVIAQVGLPRDLLSTVTAVISSAPTLGGALGISIVGTIINNTFRATLSRSIPSTSGLNVNDAVNLVFSTPPGPIRDAIINAYVHASKIGYWSLAGIAVVQFLMCACLRPVEFDEAFLDEEKIAEHGVKDS